jgi:hypothetical protein
VPACRVRARRGVGFSRSPSGRIRATLPTVSSYRGLPRIGKTRGTVPNCQRLDDWIALASRTGRRTPYWWFYYQEELNRLTNTPGKDNPCLFVATWFCWTNAAFFFFLTGHRLTHRGWIRPRRRFFSHVAWAFFLVSGSAELLGVCSGSSVRHEIFVPMRANVLCTLKHGVWTKVEHPMSKFRGLLTENTRLGRSA